MVQDSPALGNAPVMSDGVIKQVIPLTLDNKIVLRAENVRKEGKGIFAKVSVFQNDLLLAYDTFNITRDGERRKLAESATKGLRGILREELDLKRSLDLFADAAWKTLVEQRMGEPLIGFETTAPPNFALNPYILEGGGTILFAPPGAGKSWTAMLMAASIDNGINSLWPVTQAKVLFVNLERSRELMRRRLAQVNHTLGLHAEQPMLFINMRGWPLQDVAEAAKATMKKYGAEVLFLDSISRSGLGDLNDNVAANRIVDTLNQISPTWLAVGHAPRATSDHLYGSVHFDAGADIIVQTLSQPKENALGIGLQITKANDTATGCLSCYALEFKEYGLSNARKAGFRDFPEMSRGMKRNALDDIIDYVSEQGEATATETAEALKLSRQYVSEQFNRSGRFAKADKRGKEQPYRLIGS